MWDQLLDQGHVKKVKKISSDGDDYAGDDVGSGKTGDIKIGDSSGRRSVNSFQVVADNRLMASASV